VPLRSIAADGLIGVGVGIGAGGGVGVGGTITGPPQIPLLQTNGVQQSADITHVNPGVLHAKGAVVGVGVGTKLATGGRVGGVNTEPGVWKTEIPRKY